MKRRYEEQSNVPKGHISKGTISQRIANNTAGSQSVEDGPPTPNTSGLKTHQIEDPEVRSVEELLKRNKPKGIRRGGRRRRKNSS